MPKSSRKHLRAPPPGPHSAHTEDLYSSHPMTKYGKLSRVTLEKQDQQLWSFFAAATTAGGHQYRIQHHSGRADPQLLPAETYSI